MTPICTWDLHAQHHWPVVLLRFHLTNNVPKVVKLIPAKCVLSIIRWKNCMLIILLAWTVNGQCCLFTLPYAAYINMIVTVLCYWRLLCHTETVSLQHKVYFKPDYDHVARYIFGSFSLMYYEHELFFHLLLLIRVYTQCKSGLTVHDNMNMGTAMRHYNCGLYMVNFL